MSPPPDKSLVLITGANQGLGYYAAKQMAATGKYHVLMGARDVYKAEKAIQDMVADTSMHVEVENIEPLQIDITSDSSIEAAVSTVQSKFGYLDILMNNAGIPGQEPTRDEDSWKTVRPRFAHTYDTNVFSHAVVTTAFLPLLRKSTVQGGKRIQFTTSGLASFALGLDAAGAGAEGGAWPVKTYFFPIYRSSKSALNMVMLHFARMLEDEGFAVTATEPGFNNTGFNANSGPKDPRDGAKAIVRGATASKEEVHGLMIDEEGVVPW